MKYRVRYALLVALTIAMAGLIAASCSTKAKNDPPENDPPVIQIVNIPESGTHFTTSPVISWFGTDADGYITDYEYAVIRADIVEAAVDVSNEAAVRAYAAANIEAPTVGATCDPACWTNIEVRPGSNSTRQTIRLIASDSPADTVRQYFFVRAVDDNGDASVIDYSLYSRSNNPPVTDITTVPDRSGYYDAPDTLGIYKGISFDWKGTDRLDFPNEADQPDFEYYYQVFGPYSRAELSFDTTGRFTDGAGIDTLETSKLVLSSQNPSTGFGWVKAKSARLFNLHRWVPPFTTTRDDYFVFKVTTRDDAAASDPTPDMRVFRVIVPMREKKLLLWLPPFCLTRFRPGNILCDNYDTLPNMFVNPGYYTETDVVDYYKRVITSAGYPDFTVTRTQPTRREMAEFELVLMLYDGDFRHPVEDRLNPTRVFVDFGRYLDFGGKVWLWSPHPFSAFYAGIKESLNSFRANSNPALYYSILAEYRSGWEQIYINRTGWDINNPPYPITNEQFTGALALDGTEFTDVGLDQDKIQNSYIKIDFNPEVPEVLFKYPLAGPPAASYFIRSITGQPLFIYRSAHGSILPDSVSRWITGHQGTVVAVRTFNERAKFKTAVFGFPAWPLVEDQAVELARKMFDWFYAD